jgi:hypothetical protein
VAHPLQGDPLRTLQQRRRDRHQAITPGIPSFVGRFLDSMK